VAIQLDEAWLNSIGLGELPPAEKDHLLAQIYLTLEKRVGTKLSKQMSDVQMSEFYKFVQSKDMKGAMVWLKSNLPGYSQAVQEELAALKAEIAADAPKILATFKS
jgi:hypothetical protein